MSLGEPSRDVRVHGVARGRDGARPSKISSDQATESGEGIACVTVRAIEAKTVRADKAIQGHPRLARAGKGMGDSSMWVRPDHERRNGRREPLVRGAVTRGASRTGQRGGTALSAQRRDGPPNGASNPSGDRGRRRSYMVRRACPLTRASTIGLSLSRAWRASGRQQVGGTASTVLRPEPETQSGDRHATSR